MDIRCVQLRDPEYPQLLKTIHDPPEQLFVRGNLSALNSPCLAVVGTRKSTPYGTESTKSIVPPLISAGYTIISGLAFGIDATAHQTTLDHGGLTIAVLGTGIEDHQISPRTNYHLAQQILKNNGALICEFPTPPEFTRAAFPIRNRIIAGLAKATIIIEAANKSGTMLTANHALSEGRDIFALPGSITSETSEGTNHLIAKGAFPILNPATIPEHYGHKVIASVSRNERHMKQTRSRSNLDPITTQIHHLCITQKIPPDLVAHQLNLPISTILSTLTMLELSNP